MSKPHYKPETTARAASTKSAGKLQVAVVTAAPPETLADPIAAELDTTNNEDTTTDQVTREQVQTLAYLKWESAGKPEGNGISFWLEAEQELRSIK